AKSPSRTVVFAFRWSRTVASRLRRRAQKPDKSINQSFSRWARQGLNLRPLPCEGNASAGPKRSDSSPSPATQARAPGGAARSRLLRPPRRGRARRAALQHPDSVGERTFAAARTVVPIAADRSIRPCAVGGEDSIDRRTRPFNEAGEPRHFRGNVADAF